MLECAIHPITYRGEGILLRLLKSDSLLISSPENISSEYSCAVTPQVRQTGNRLSGLAGTAYASLLT